MKKQENNQEIKDKIQKNDKYSTEFGKSEMLEYEHRSKQIDRDEENTAY
ncbi:hypothetical protein [Vallitalea guaymasensis]|uniref:Uncharacterized protein n=1 Tax=Vallitalea guaymasensis TaxID=1185412 RepID=A0A8J8SED6_9FIRM|nr:hypothetical protein [Vallitalea guaymasensis]QUH31599.1 hypothetical protein HYG85_22780 [Vallitalea guaymasensis]